MYSIDANGEVKILLDNLILSNGLEWSMDEKRFYHTDSETQSILEYDFDKKNGTVSPTGRKIAVPGVDGFTIDINDNILATNWGYGGVAVIDTHTMEIVDYIKVPANNIASCGFAGDDMEYLAITTASYEADTTKAINEGFTFLQECSVHGRKPYLFG